MQATVPVSIQVIQGGPVVMLEVSADHQVYVVNGVKLDTNWNIQARLRDSNGSVCTSVENVVVTEAVTEWFREQKGEQITVSWNPREDRRNVLVSRLIDKIQRL